MKIKKLGYISLIALIILSLLPGLATMTANAKPYPGGSGCTIWVDDEDASFGPGPPDPGNLTCNTFNVTIKMQNAPASPNVSAWEFKLWFNTTVLDAVWVYQNPAWPEPPYSWNPKNASLMWPPNAPPVLDNSIGRVFVGWVCPPGSELTGNYTLVTILFHIKMAPTRVTGSTVWANSTLSLNETAVKDPFLSPIAHSTIDGEYYYGRPPIVPGEVTAEFSYPGSVYVCDTVTCTWTGTAGSGAWITLYDWSLSGPGEWTDVGNQTVVQFHCNGTGTVTVTLNATNNFDNWDDVSHDIEQIEKLGPIIDLYTSENRWCGVDTDPENVGKGPDMPADALSPDVNVTLFAEVTYNGAPVNHVLVAFEVRWMYNISWCEYDPEGEWDLVDECVLFRTGETNKDGLAQIWFRVPTPCAGQMFGKWKAWAKAKVQEVPINDTMEFDVGYLVTMCELEILPPYPDAFIREVDCLTANVTFKSISWIPRSVKFIMVLYDECDVPIGQMFVDTETLPAYYCSPTTSSVEITVCVPQWAYVGFGKVYVSAFTTWPHDCGVAYSPEISVDDIEISWIGA